jgi:hypothetical protein
VVGSLRFYAYREGSVSLVDSNCCNRTGLRVFYRQCDVGRCLPREVRDRNGPFGSNPMMGFIATRNDQRDAIVADITIRKRRELLFVVNGSLWRIVLKKSFLGDE